MIAPRFKAKITFKNENSYKLEENHFWLMWLSTAFKKGDTVEIIVKKWVTKKSHLQNKYYWGVIIKILATHTGYSKEEMHETLKWKFLCDIDSDPLLPKTLNYKKLTTAKQEEYHEEIRQFFLEQYNIFIPLPDRCHYDKVEEVYEKDL